MRIRLILLLSLLFGLISCDDPFYKGSPQFILYIQDLPAQEINSLNLSFVKVELFNNSEWIDVKCNNSTFNVIDYNGGTMFELTKATIAAGKYSKFRMTLSPQFNSIDYKGAKHLLLYTSENSVLNFDYEFEASEDKQEIVVCDIDVAKSISGDVDKGQFWFNPNVTLINLNSWGVVQGVLVDAAHKRLNRRCLVRATRSDGYQLNNYTTNAGDLFIRLPEGLYTIVVTPQSTANLPVITILNVVVKAGQPTSVGGVVLALPTN